MSVSEARAAMLELLRRVGDGEDVTITRHGRPVAVVVRPDRLGVRRSSAALDEAHRLHKLLAAAGKQPRGGTISSERAEELVRHVRADRDSTR